MWENGSETNTIEFGGGFSLIVKSLLSVAARLAEFGPRETQERSSTATGSGNQKSRRGSNALLHVSWVGFASGPSLLLLCTLVLALFGTAVLRDVGIVMQGGAWVQGGLGRRQKQTKGCHSKHT